MNEEQDGDWCTLVFDVKSNGLAMQWCQIICEAITIIVYKDEMPGLLVINMWHDGSETETHSGLKPYKEIPIIKCSMMVWAHQQPITGFMLRCPF
jgi:hypothetical protein